MRSLLISSLIIVLLSAPPLRAVDAGFIGTKDKLSIRVKNADVRDLLLSLAEISGRNIIIDPTVKGKVTLYLRDVSWRTVLESVLFFTDLGYVEVGVNGIVAPYDRLGGGINRLRGTKETAQAENVELTLPLDFEVAKRLWPGVKKLLSSEGRFFHDRKKNSIKIVDKPENASLALEYIILNKETDEIREKENDR